MEKTSERIQSFLSCNIREKVAIETTKNVLKEIVAMMPHNEDDLLNVATGEFFEIGDIEKAIWIMETLQNTVFAVEHVQEWGCKDEL